MTNHTNESTPEIKSTGPTFDTNTQEPPTQRDGEPAITEFQTGAGLEKLKAEDPVRYERALSCWLIKAHMNAGTRIAVQLNDQDEVVGFKCEARTSNPKCRYDATKIHAHWIALGPTVDTENVAVPLTQTKTAGSKKTGNHMKNFIEHRKKTEVRGPPVSGSQENVIDAESSKDSEISTHDLLQRILLQNEENQKMNLRMMEALAEKAKAVESMADHHKQQPNPASDRWVKRGARGQKNSGKANSRPASVVNKNNDSAPKRRAFHRSPRSNPRGYYQNRNQNSYSDGSVMFQNHPAPMYDGNRAYFIAPPAQNASTYQPIQPNTGMYHNTAVSQPLPQWPGHMMTPYQATAAPEYTQSANTHSYRYH